MNNKDFLILRHAGRLFMYIMNNKGPKILLGELQKEPARGRQRSVDMDMLSSPRQVAFKPLPQIALKAMTVKFIK